MLLENLLFAQMAMPCNFSRNRMDPCMCVRVSIYIYIHVFVTVLSSQ